MTSAGLVTEWLASGSRGDDEDAGFSVLFALVIVTGSEVGLLAGVISAIRSEVLCMGMTLSDVVGFLAAVPFSTTTGITLSFFLVLPPSASLAAADGALGSLTGLVRSPGI